MRYFILIFTLVCSFVAAQPTIVPQLQQQVTDLTSSLNSQEKKELTRKLESIFNNTQVQIAVLIIPTTKDETIEQYAARVFDNWRLGDAKRNDGILIIVAWSDRTVRIQVGYHNTNIRLILQKVNQHLPAIITTLLFFGYLQ